MPSIMLLLWVGIRVPCIVGFIISVSVLGIFVKQWVCQGYYLVARTPWWVGKYWRFSHWWFWFFRICHCNCFWCYIYSCKHILSILFIIFLGDNQGVVRLLILHQMYFSLVFSLHILIYFYQFNLTLLMKQPWLLSQDTLNIFW